MKKILTYFLVFLLVFSSPVLSFFSITSFADDVTNQKTRILEIVHETIDEINAGTDTNTAIQNAVIKLMGVDGLVSECNVLAMPAIITKVTSKDGLVDIFQTLIDNIDEVYSYGEDIKAAFDEKDYNAAAEAFGHILAIALDFTVNL